MFINIILNCINSKTNEKNDYTCPIEPNYFTGDPKGIIHKTRILYNIQIPGGGHSHHILVPCAYKNPRKKGGNFERNRGPSGKLKTGKRGVKSSSFPRFSKIGGYKKSPVSAFFQISGIIFLPSVKCQ